MASCMTLKIIKVFLKLF